MIIHHWLSTTFFAFLGMQPRRLTTTRLKMVVKQLNLVLVQRAYGRWYRILPMHKKWSFLNPFVDEWSVWTQWIFLLDFFHVWKLQSYRSFHLVMKWVFIHSNRQKMFSNIEVTFDFFPVFIYQNHIIIKISNRRLICQISVIRLFTWSVNFFLFYISV